MDPLISSVISMEALLSLAPEELAGIILKFLNSLTPTVAKGLLNRDVIAGEYGVKGYPPEHRDQIGRAIMEAWVYLEREGLVAPRPGDPHGWVFITRRGQAIKNATDFETFRKASLLPKPILHPTIVE